MIITVNSLRKQLLQLQLLLRQTLMTIKQKEDIHQKGSGATGHYFEPVPFRCFPKK